MKTYKISGHGNYSITYGWDDGISLSKPVLTDEEFTANETLFMGLYVNETYTNIHGGSRDIDLVVRAFDEQDAAFYALLYCNYYYQ